MVKVLFFCLGNICRSPMAEAVFRQLVDDRGLADRIEIDSAGTSNYNEGMGVHRGTVERLAREGISTAGMTSRPLVAADADYDYIVGMDQSNMDNLARILGDQVADKSYRLLNFAGKERDILDPYYTGNFEVTYDDVLAGCQGLLDYIIANDLED